MRSYVLIECEKRARWLYWGVGLCASLWLGLLWLAPWLLATKQVLPGLVLYRVFALVCHQLPERSLSCFQFPLPVCARCTGIYFGFAASWWLAVRLPAMRRTWLIAALSLLAVDWLVGLYLMTQGLNTAATRVFTGGIAGSALSWWLGSRRHSLTGISLFDGK